MTTFERRRRSEIEHKLVFGGAIDSRFGGVSSAQYFRNHDSGVAEITQKVGSEPINPPSRAKCGNNVMAGKRYDSAWSASSLVLALTKGRRQEQ